MKSIELKKLAPHLIAVIAFIAISFAYFSPVLEGKKLKQGDIVHFKGMSKEIIDWRKKTGDEPLWTNSSFGGMPAFQISVKYPSNLMQYVDRTFRLWMTGPVSMLFLYLIGFYILLMSLKVDPWLAIAGAVAFAFSTYFFIILEAGHNSKAHAIGYMAPIFAGVILTFRGKLIVGGALTALFLALQLKANHIQITYYLMMMLLIYGIFKFVDSIRNKELMPFFKAAGVLVIAVILAVGTNITNLWCTYEYSQYTTRAKSELTTNQKDKTSGLDRSYVTQWSYGIGESMTLLVPNFKGGPSGYIGNEPSLLKDVSPQYKQTISQMDSYFGNQPFTSGPVYVGAFILFLFVLGLLILSGWLRWVMLLSAMLAIMLSWGSNWMYFTNFFLDYFPGYNKFRAVTIILVIAELAIPILAVLTLDKILKEPEILKRKKKHFYTALGITGGLCLLMYILPDSFNTFFKDGEIQRFTGELEKANFNEAQMALFFSNLEDVRMNIFKPDVLRSLVFILLGGGLILLYSRKVLKRNLFIAAVLVLIVADLWTVNKRYLNKTNFTSKTQIKVPFQPNAADRQILADPDPNFRVFSQLARLDQDSRTSYFHKSLGGYHGAKFKRYQELIDFQIGKGNMGVINMLNTKYVIGNTEQGPVAQMNPGALGNAWFVNEYKVVANADSEITALTNFDPAKEAVVDQRFNKQLAGLTIAPDPTNQISLSEYKPNHLTYQSNAQSTQLAVFSEIYYDKGWNAYVDGEPKPHFRVNYVLRAMLVPEGAHTIEFKFEPKSYSTGEAISMACSTILLLLLFGTAYMEWKKRRQQTVSD